MHRVGVAALACLLVLAGCSAVPGGGPATPSETVTPAPVPETDIGAEELAPGLTGQGVTDPLRLANAHSEALGRDYRFRSAWTVRYPNGTLYAHATQEAAVAPGGFRVRVTASGRPGFLTTGPRVEAVFWSNGTVLAERIRRGSAEGDADGATGGNATASYRYLGPETYNGGTGFYNSLRRPKPWRDHFALYAAMETRVVDAQAGGRAPDRYTVVGTELRDPSTFAAATNVRRPANVTLWTVVDENGVVRSHRLSYSGTLPTGERVRVTRRVRYTDLGEVESVPRPEWFDRARNGSTSSRGSIPNP